MRQLFRVFRAGIYDKLPVFLRESDGGKYEILRFIIALVGRASFRH